MTRPVRPFFFAFASMSKGVGTVKSAMDNVANALADGPTPSPIPAVGPIITLAFLYPKRYSQAVIEIRQTETYSKWFENLRDRQARARIDTRIRRLSLGNPGDVKPVGEGVSELRVDYGPGYRVYFTQRAQALVILLAGGDKRTQSRDIKLALELAREL